MNNTNREPNPSDTFINNVNNIFGQHPYSSPESTPTAAGKAADKGDKKSGKDAKPKGEDLKRHSSNEVPAVSGQAVIGEDGIAYLKKLGMQVPGLMPAEDQWTLPNDFKISPSKSHRSPWASTAVTVTELYNRLGTKYQPSKVHCISDLLRVNYDYARGALCGIVNAGIQDLKDVFCWQDGNKPFAPNITFALRENAVLRHDEYGRFYNPAALVFNDDILAQCGFYTKGVKTGATWGKFEPVPAKSGMGSGIFQPTSDIEATDLLLVTKWGGPNSTTRGTDQEAISSLLPADALKYFEKCSSQKGKLGYDYIVLSIDAKPKLRNVIHCAEMQRRSIFDQHEAIYYQKLQLIDIIKDRNPAIDAFVDTTNHQLDALRKRCDDNPVTARPFVHKPNIQFVENPEISLTPRLKLSELTELAAKQERITSESASYLLQTEIAVKAWETFASEFVKAEKIVHSLYGWLNIYGDHVAVTLPCQSSDTMRITKEYVLSAEGLHAYLSDLCVKQGQYENWRRACQQQLKQLLSADNLERLGRPFEMDDTEEAATDFEGQPQPDSPDTAGEVGAANSDGDAPAGAQPDDSNADNDFPGYGTF